jgi:heterodisulfide reductase subunit A
MAEKIGAVMVVGGGITGVQTALDLGDSGFKVYLLEKKASIGGTMAQLDKTFPTNDCSMCIMAPKLVAAGNHQNVDLITNAEIEDVAGEPGNFTVKVRRNTLRVNEEKCTGCGQCAVKCPVETFDEYNQGLKKRKAIYVAYPQAVPLIFCIDKSTCIGCGICAGECMAKAVEYELKDQTMEIQVGSVILCPGFEEFDARLKKEYGYGEYKNVVTSIEFERMLSATGPYLGTVMRPSEGEIPRRVAFIQCVGSRDEKVGNPYCSSVCCMYAIKEAIIAGEHTAGLKPSIFFMDVRAFGKEFEYYRERAEKEYGVKMYRGSRVASVEEDPKTKNLFLRYSIGDETNTEEFDLVVLSVGMKPAADGEMLSKKFGFKLNKYGFCETDVFSPLSTSKPGIFVSGSFAAPKDIPESVAQASGAAALATSTIASERGKLVSSKQFPPEMDVFAKRPRIGVFVCHCGINIGGVVDVPSVMKYAATLPDVVYSGMNLFTCSSDTQKKMREMIKEHGLNRVVVASCSPRTHEPLFRDTCMDAGLNPYLFEMTNIRDQCSWVHMHEPEKATEKAKDLVRMAIAKARLLKPLKKAKLGVTHSAVVVGGGLAGMTAALNVADQGYSVHLIEKEAQLGGNLARLYHKEGDRKPREFMSELIGKVRDAENITVHLNTQVIDVGGFVGNFKVKTTDGEIETGTIIVATGANEYKPSEYLYGQDKRVITQLELEKQLDEKTLKAKKVVMIQCVGSRNEKVPYCSRTCCANAVKNAIDIKKASPATEVYVLHKDIRTYGFREELYREAGELGVSFLRFPEGIMPTIENKAGQLEVTAFDTVLKGDVMIKPDLLVLSVGMRPNEGNEELAKMLKVPLSRDGFFLEAHMKLRPVDFATEGIFLAGAAHWPKFIDEVIAQASGAATRAITIISKDFLETEGIIAAVNEMVCNGCGVCEPVCEYKAITIVKDPGNPDKLKAVVNEGLCKGCGTCVAACPSAAMEQKGFKDAQMYAMIDAALQEGK